MWLYVHTHTRSCLSCLKVVEQLKSITVVRFHVFVERFGCDMYTWMDGDGVGNMYMLVVLVYVVGR